MGTSVNEFKDSEIQRDIYKFRASGYYSLDGESHEITYENFRSIVIDRDYEKNNMPLVYIIFNLSSKLTDIVVKNIKKGVFIINIQKTIDNADTGEIWEDYINDTFVYFLQEDVNKVDERTYEYVNEDREDLYSELTVGLLSQTLINNNKKVVNGILNCNDMASAVAYTLSGGTPIVMEPFNYNKPLKRIILPPCNSKSKCVKYLDGLRTFYNTPYRFFMDMDCIYLLSQSGKKVPRKGEQINSVHITLQDEYIAESKMQGMITETEKGYYGIDISGVDADAADYSGTEYTATKIQVMDRKGKGTKTDIADTSGANYTTKTVNLRASNDNIAALQNARNHSYRFLSVTKTDIDCSVMTPNKEYVVDADKVYKDGDYSGNYYVVRKRELFFKGGDGAESEKFTCSTMLFMEKVYK